MEDPEKGPGENFSALINQLAKTDNAKADPNLLILEGNPISVCTSSVKKAMEINDFGVLRSFEVRKLYLPYLRKKAVVEDDTEYVQHEPAWGVEDLSESPCRVMVENMQHLFSNSYMVTSVILVRMKKQFRDTPVGRIESSFDFVDCLYSVQKPNSASMDSFKKFLEDHGNFSENQKREIRDFLISVTNSRQQSGGILQSNMSVIPMMMSSIPAPALQNFIVSHMDFNADFLRSIESSLISHFFGASVGFRLMSNDCIWLVKHIAMNPQNAFSFQKLLWLLDQRVRAYAARDAICTCFINEFNTFEKFFPIAKKAIALAADMGCSQMNLHICETILAEKDLLKNLFLMERHWGGKGLVLFNAQGQWKTNDCIVKNEGVIDLLKNNSLYEFIGDVKTNRIEIVPISWSAASKTFLNMVLRKKDVYACSCNHSILKISELVQNLIANYGFGDSYASKTLFVVPTDTEKKMFESPSCEFIFSCSDAIAFMKGERFCNYPEQFSIDKIEKVVFIRSEAMALNTFIEILGFENMIRGEIDPYETAAIKRESEIATNVREVYFFGNSDTAKVFSVGRGPDCVFPTIFSYLRKNKPENIININDNSVVKGEDFVKTLFSRGEFNSSEIKISDHISHSIDVEDYSNWTSSEILVLFSSSPWIAYSDDNQLHIASGKCVNACGLSYFDLFKDRNMMSGKFFVSGIFNICDTGEICKIQRIHSGTFDVVPCDIPTNMDSHKVFIGNKTHMNQVDIFPTQTDHGICCESALKTWRYRMMNDDERRYGIKFLSGQLASSKYRPTIEERTLRPKYHFTQQMLGMRISEYCGPCAKTVFLVCNSNDKRLTASQISSALNFAQKELVLIAPFGTQELKNMIDFTSINKRYIVYWMFRTFETDKTVYNEVESDNEMPNSVIMEEEAESEYEKEKSDNEMDSSDDNNSSSSDSDSSDSDDAKESSSESEESDDDTVVVERTKQKLGKIKLNSNESAEDDDVVLFDEKDDSDKQESDDESDNQESDEEDEKDEKEEMEEDDESDKDDEDAESDNDEGDESGLSEYELEERRKDRENKKIKNKDEEMTPVVEDDDFI